MQYVPISEPPSHLLVHPFVASASRLTLSASRPLLIKLENCQTSAMPHSIPMTTSSQTEDDNSSLPDAPTQPSDENRGENEIDNNNNNKNDIKLEDLFNDDDDDDDFPSSETMSGELKSSPPTNPP